MIILSGSGSGHWQRFVSETLEERDQEYLLAIINQFQCILNYSVCSELKEKKFKVVYIVIIAYGNSDMSAQGEMI